MKKHCCSILIFVLANTFYGFGQIYSSKADFVEITDYETLDRTDSIYVFNLSKSDGSTNIGELEINSPDGASNWDFSWYPFDKNLIAFNFQDLLKTENNANYSSLINVGEGGYSVIYTNGIEMDTAYAWVFVNDFISRGFEIVRKDSEGKLTDGFTCDYVELKAFVELDTFFYFDVVSKVPNAIITSYQYTWTSDPEGNPQITQSGFQFPEIRTRTYDPPTKDTYYFLKITDKYGIEKNDTVFYETIHTKAVIDTIPYWIYFDDGEDYYAINEKASAPFTVLFSPKESENAYKYVWNFDAGEGDTTYYQADSVEYTFYYIDPQKDLNPYNVKLTTFSEDGCTSSDSVEIELLASDLFAPNYFSPPDADNIVTPNGDGKNDRWRIYDVSLREFELWIFNRWGRIVHKFDGDDIRDWQGWDGNMKDSNRPAPEGVYYYVLRARGWDKEEAAPDKTMKYEYHGFFHLYRENRR